MSATVTARWPQLSTSAVRTGGISGRVAAPGTISTIFISGTGLKKCSPARRVGSFRAAAIRVTERDEVLVAKTAVAGSARSSRPKTSVLVPRSSRTASTTSSTSGPGAHGSSSGISRSRAAARSPADIRPFWTARSSMDPTKSTAAVTASVRTSHSSTVCPAVAAHWAMPRPMAPAPTILIRMAVAVLSRCDM